MVGSAVETMVWSSAASSIPSRSAPRMSQSRRFVICSPTGGGATSAAATVTPHSSYQPPGTLHTTK